MKRRLIIGFAILAAVAFVLLPAALALLAQATDAATQPMETNPPSALVLLSSVAGVVAATIGVTTAIKRGLENTKLGEKIPNWLILVAVATGLTCLAHFGLGLLKGDVFKLIADVVVQTLMAAGVFSLWDGRKATPATSAESREAKHEEGGTLTKGLMLAGLLSVAVVAGGCAKSPEARYYQARSSVTTAEDLMSDLYEAGKIPPREMVAGGEAVKAARRSLEVMKAQLPDGSPTFDQYFKSINGAILPLIQLYLPKGKSNGPGHTRLDRHGGPEGRGVFGDADRHPEGRGQDQPGTGGGDRGGGEDGGRTLRPELGRCPGEARGWRGLIVPPFTVNWNATRFLRAA